MIDAYLTYLFCGIFAFISLSDWYFQVQSVNKIISDIFIFKRLKYANQIYTTIR